MSRAGAKFVKNFKAVLTVWTKGLHPPRSAVFLLSTMAKDNTGWVSIHRKIFDMDGYFSEPFCRNMAWVDLILLANHETNFFRARGIKVEVNRGQVGYGLDELGRRWKWSRGKVERFMKELENDERIVRQKNNVTTLISISNYIDYQNNDKANGKASDKANSKADGQQTVKQTDANNNSNNVNNENNLFPAEAPPVNFKKVNHDDFYNSVAEFKDLYPKEMLRAFFNYWSEKDQRGKMKFQLQKTWELKKRLVTWQANNSKFAKNGTNSERYKESGGSIVFDRA